MIVPGNGRTSKTFQHVIIIIFGYPAILVKVSLTDPCCKTLVTGNNLGMLDMKFDSPPCLEYTTYVMLVKDELDVIVLERGRISAAGVMVSNVFA